MLDCSTERSIVATDAEGAIVLWNEGARRLYGYSASEIVGRSWTALHRGDDADAGLLAKIAERVAREGKWEDAVEAVRNDRSRFMSRTVVTPQLRLDHERGDGGRVARFSVIDTGCGIRPEDQERQFAAFEQIGGPGSRPYEGTGLGLYICQTLATALGGAIGFESTFGEGSCFTLELRE
ncbi:MAG: ATP-binding protein [Solirubrobacteraceae bacterium]